MAAYYNEFDKGAAAWLRELIRRDLIAPGDVDERSIEDVRPDDLRGYTQHHFFAGIGGWSYALRLAGWPDDRPVWTGSCPCQPFSTAGQGAGFADERHLWPAWFHLIRECRPSVIFGEQVASKDADPWLDLVQADLEGMGYAFGCVPFPSAGIGAPHIRDRNYWLAYAGGAGHSEQRRQWDEPARLAAAVVACRLADASGSGRREECADDGRLAVGDCAQGLTAGLEHGRGDRWPSPLHGFWRAADWLLCRDGKWRPVEPGTFPLADGIPARVVRLRGYGNAINPHQAAEFVRASGLMDEAT